MNTDENTDDPFDASEDDHIKKLEQEIKNLEGAANVPRRDSLKRTPPKFRSFSISDPVTTQTSEGSPDRDRKRNRDSESESPEARELKTAKIKMTKDQEEMAKKTKVIEAMLKKEQEQEEKRKEKALLEKTEKEKKEKIEKERQEKTEKEKKKKADQENIIKGASSASVGLVSGSAAQIIPNISQDNTDNERQNEGTEKKYERSGYKDNSAFATKEQKTVLNGLDEITTLYADLITQLLLQEIEINKLQQENISLKSNRQTTDTSEDRLKNLQYEIIKAIKPTQSSQPTMTNQTSVNTPPTHTTSTDFPQLGQRTYAQLTKKTNTTTNTQEKKPWTTPEQTKKYDTVIKIKEGETGNTITELKKVIKPKDMEGTQIRHTRTAIVLTSQTKEKQNEILRRTQQSTTLDIKDGTRQNEPTAILTGLRKEMTMDELTEALKMENDDLNENFGDRLKLLTVVSTRPCRNPYKENIYIRGPTDIIKYLLKTGKVYVDFQTIFINEATQIALCFRCCKYGHVSKYCKETTPTCYRCGDGHDGNTCNKDIYNCINCERLRLTPRGHQARDANCPIYNKKMDEARAQTSYK
ncbi:unnamed protein product [Psylliodes chrysocephalus]|uniref:CCHC-type domain-containing protein n=1 Tax=Psylliodes chrysocephalus TaxID=3402493 RepID=A0A9P0CYP7_9CUCU|nr:unnamed protein product [Psylliodes chrysocephala]